MKTNLPSNFSSRIGRNLRARLMAAFILVAALPALLALGVQTMQTQAVLQSTVGALGRADEEAIRDVSQEVRSASERTLNQTSTQLIGLSESSIRETSGRLVHLSQHKLTEASRRIANVSEKANAGFTQNMVAFSRESHTRLGADLRHLQADANRELVEATTQATEQTLTAHTERLSALTKDLSGNLNGYLAQENQRAAAEVATRMKAELARDPLVDFRTVARLMAQAFANGKVTDRPEAFVMLVNRKGEVVASTRHKRGKSVKDLEIVRRALNDDAATAEQWPLVSFSEGGEPFIGVYERRPTGGVVIVAYNTARAEGDMTRVQKSVDSSFVSLLSLSSAGTRTALENTASQIQAQMRSLSAIAADRIRTEATRVSRQTDARMAHHTQNLTQVAARQVSEEANRNLASVRGQIQTQSRQVLSAALADMAPIGHESAQRAVSTMSSRAENAVAAIQAQMEPEIAKVGQTAQGRVAVAAKEAAADTWRQTFKMALLVLLLSLAMGIAVSAWLSSRIADPIEVEQQLRQAELSRIEQEMDIAARIQTALVPKRWELEGYDMALELVTATEVGGDMIDFVPGPDGQFWLAAGDVTGHGLTPGLIMMMAQSLFTGLAMAEPNASPSTLLSRLNRALHQNIQYRLCNDSLMTLQLIRHAGGGRFVGSGLHCAPLIFRAGSGQVERISMPGIWLGLLPEVDEHLEDVCFDLEEGDVLLLYTDGLIEGRNRQREQFDLPRLETVFARHAAESVEAIKAAILKEVREWLADQSDDISLIVLKRQFSSLTPVAGSARLKEITHA